MTTQQTHAANTAADSGTQEGAVIELYMIQAHQREELTRGVAARLPRGHRVRVVNAVGELDSAKAALEHVRTSRTSSMRTLLKAARDYFDAIGRAEREVWTAFVALAAEAHTQAEHERAAAREIEAEEREGVTA